MDKLSENTSVEISSIAKYAYLAAGFILIGIGVLGIFLPLLPTTIFLILASACFMKSSPRANRWLEENKYLGVYIKNYRDKTGVPLSSKISNIILLWLSISISMYFLTEELYIRITLLAVGIGVTIHLLLIKTKVN